MNGLLAIKNDELFTEFNRYVLEHPEFLVDIPDNALLVLVDPTDPEFNQHNVKRNAEYLRQDDQSKRTVVYIDVGELAPIHSRLINPRIVPEIPGLVAA